MKALKRVLATLLLLVLGLAVWWAWTTREREFTGVWVSSFENSAFYEGVSASDVERRKQVEAGWLEFDRSARIPSRHFEKFDPDCGDYSRFELTFVGQRYPGPAGHLSSFDGRYRATKILSATPLPRDCDPPKIGVGD